MPSIEEPPEPWRSFFAEVDSRLSEDVYLHCCGGFVVTQLYGVARTTNDVDFLGVVPNVRNDLARMAGKGSALHRKHKVYFDAVTVATPPENYEGRLAPMFPGAWQRLRLLALEAHDLALSKLERNFERDRAEPTWFLFVFSWRRGWESNPRIKVLQTSALPLGYRA